MALPHTKLFVAFLPAKACRVIPPIWQAATPVLAVANVFSGARALRIRFSRKDFPVPALPVKNTLRPAITALITRFCSAVKRRGTIGRATAIVFWKMDTEKKDQN